MSDQTAVILSGGMGTRLRPLTFNCPKPLVPFCNISIIEHQIKALYQAGFKKIILAVSDRPKQLDQLTQAKKVLKEKYDVTIKLSVEHVPLGTAGPLAIAKKYIDCEDFIVMNGDIICCYPLKDLMQFHLSHKKEGTILTTTSKTPWKYGVIISDVDGCIQSFIEKPTDFVGDQINAGISVFNKRIFERIEEKFSSIEREIYPEMAKDKELYAFRIPGDKNFWMDIGHPMDYILGTQIYLKHMNLNSMIHKSVKVITTLGIKNNVVIGENCVLSENVSIDNSVIFSGCFIGRNTKITNSIIGWDCVLNDNCVIEDCVLEKDIVVNEGLCLKNNKICSSKNIRAEVNEGEDILD